MKNHTDNVPWDKYEEELGDDHDGEYSTDYLDGAIWAVSGLIERFESIDLESLRELQKALIGLKLDSL